MNIQSLVAALLLACTTSVSAQTKPHPGGRLRVFIDCHVRGCDSEFFRIEIPFVDHVRDRADADVHVLVASQGTGGGGTRFSVNFIPRGSGSARADSLDLLTAQSSTQDEQRRALVRIIKLGLVPFLARLPDSDRLNVTYSSSGSTPASSADPKKDRWNMWVFRVGTNSNFNGEKSQRSAYLNGSTSAKRTTEDWKVSIVANGSYSEGKYTFSGGSRFANYSHSYGASELVVKSLGPHWSAGQRASFSSSTYLNQKVNIRVAPAVEYNFFPYAESTRRQFTLQYSPGISHYKYEEITVFGKTGETHPNQTLTASLDLKQPWGTVSSSLEGASLLDDFSKNRAVSYTSLNLRLFKGFNFNMYSGISLIRDQLYLPGADLTDEEILTRRRQLATSYSYFGGIGLSYTFGSIFNSVVNSRFGGSSGGFIIYE